MFNASALLGSACSQEGSLDRFLAKEAARAKSTGRDKSGVDFVKSLVETTVVNKRALELEEQLAIEQDRCRALEQALRNAGLPLPC